MASVSMGALLTLSGCWGGGSGQTGPALPRAVLVNKANDICAAAAQRIRTGGVTAFPNPRVAGMQDPALVEAFAKNVVLPALQHEYAQLRVLRPTSDTNTGDTLDALEAAIDKWEFDKTVMATVNDRSFARFDSLATDFGWSTCAATDGLVRAITLGQPVPGV